MKKDAIGNSIENNFKKLYLGEWKSESDYELYYKLWVEYRNKTNHLTEREGGKAYKIHKKLFCDLPKNYNYEQAKKDSLLTKGK